MKHIILFFVLILAFNNINAQPLRQANSLQKENGKYYLLESGRKSLVNDKVITVKIKKETETTDDAIAGIIPIRKNKLGFMDVAVPNGISLDEFATQLSNSGCFEIVKYNTYGTVCFEPNDPGIIYQWYLDSIKAPDAWNYAMGSSTVKVAVIDQIQYFSHPDLYNVSASYNNIDWSLGYDYTGKTSSTHHGVSVAGVIAAKSNNMIGLAGVCGGKNSIGTCILPFNVSDEGEDIDMSVVDDAIIQATDNGAKIINMSFGSNYSYFPDIDSALNYAKSHGVILVAASGNDTITNWIRYPASHADVIAVGSIRQDLNISVFSNSSNGLDLVAPGESIATISIDSSTGYAYRGGTSFAAPQVAAVAALMLSVNPNLTVNQVRSILRSSSRDLGSTGFDTTFGYGLVDAYAAVLESASLINLQLSGPTIPSSPSTYTVDNLPSEWSVVWSMLVHTTLPSYCTANFPENNQLQIDNSSKQHIKETLVAKVYKVDGTLEHAFAKDIDTSFGFSGTYLQTVPTPNQIISGTFYDGSLIHVKQGLFVYLTSNDFYGATVSCTNTNPPVIHTSGNTVNVYFYNSTSFSSATLHCVKGDKVIEFRLRAEPILQIDPILHLMTNISGGDNSINISLSENVDSGQPMRGNTFDSWELTIYSYTTGKVVHRQKVSGRSVSIDTSAWEPDTYIVRIWIDDKEIVKKFVLE